MDGQMTTQTNKRKKEMSVDMIIFSNTKQALNL
jgi:hypothetical protein